MSFCENCSCFNDSWIEGEENENELENDPNYEPHRYYYWHGDIQEDYQMPKGYECLCEACYGNFLNEGKIIEKFDDLTGKPNPKWDPETMGWFIPDDVKIDT